MPHRARLEAVALVLLRTLIGWHFLYEGYYKLVSPGWTRGGAPVAAWSASGYLKAATGPLAGAFHALGQSSMAGWVDHARADWAGAGRPLADARPVHADRAVGRAWRF